MKEKIKKYLGDILILGGIWIFSYVLYFPGQFKSGGSSITPVVRLGTPSVDSSSSFKFIAIVLITIGIDIAIRKYLSFKNERRDY
jgi:hypothetical protein